MIFTVNEEYSGKRLDVCISEILSGDIDDIDIEYQSEDTESDNIISRSRIQKLSEEGLIFVNEKVCKAGKKLKAGDVVSFTLPEAKEPDILPEDIPLDILYEDDDLIIINKPKGMVVHPGAGHYSNTLVNALLYHCRGTLSGINGVLRPGIVHRIDMDTTGSLIVCKNDRAHNHIAKQLKVHSIKREYEAIAIGSFSSPEGTVDMPIGRDPANRKRMKAGVPGGKNAITHYRVIKDYGSLSHVKCVLETGRTHQIRAHLSSIGHPLLGDEVYGGAMKKGFPGIKTTLPGSKAAMSGIKTALQGQTLHAGLIGFIHPASGEYMEFRAPLPDYFRDILVYLEKNICL